MTPDFWVLTLTSEIATNLTVETYENNNTKIKEIAVKSENKCQIVSEENWMKTIQLSVKKYIEKVKSHSGSF